MLIDIKTESVNMPALELADLHIHGQHAAPELRWAFRKEKRYALINIRGWLYTATADNGFEAEIHTDLGNAVRYASVGRVKGEHCDITVADVTNAKTPGEALVMAYRTALKNPPERWPICPGPPDRVYTPEHPIPPGEVDNHLDIPICRRCANAASIRAVSKRINPILRVEQDTTAIRPHIAPPNIIDQWRTATDRARNSLSRNATGTNPKIRV